MIINKVLMELGKAGIPCTWQGGDEMTDDMIDITNHPMGLHIQFTPYAPFPFQLCWWTNARKIAMNMIEYRTIPELMSAIKELTNK